LIVPNAVISALLALPLLPVSTANVTAVVNPELAETIGWPEVAGDVAAVVHKLPPAEQNTAIVLAATYGEAGAVALYGPPLGLRHVYSPHNSYADFGRPHDQQAAVVAVRYSRAFLEQYFGQCQDAGRIDNGRGVDNEAQHAPIVVCHNLLRSWPATWKSMRFLA
jgi:hypothetical protein